MGLSCTLLPVLSDAVSCCAYMILVYCSWHACPARTLRSEVCTQLSHLTDSAAHMQAAVMVVYDWLMVPQLPEGSGASQHEARSSFSNKQSRPRPSRPRPQFMTHCFATLLALPHLMPCQAAGTTRRHMQGHSNMSRLVPPSATRSSLMLVLMPGLC